MSGLKWKVGMQRLQPGVYVDRNDALHIDLEELCLNAGIPPTDENQAMLMRAAEEVFRSRQIVEAQPERKL